MSTNESGTNRPSVDILYVITKSNWGGAQRHVYDLAVAAKQTLSVAVALGGDGVLAHKLRTADIEAHGIAALQRDISLGKELYALIDLFRLFRQMRPTTVHLHSPKAGGLGAFAAQLAGVPQVIYTSHGLPFEEDRPWWQKAVLVFFTWLTFILCDTVILITQANLHKVSKMPWLGRRIRFIRSGIDPVDPLPRDDARNRLREMSGATEVTSSTTWIGTIAEYHPVKGLEYLIRGIGLVRRKHPDVICMLIGGGEQEGRLNEIIEECGLSKNVFLVGFIDAAARYLSAFDIFALTSLKEGLPYVVLEAGSIGVGFVGSSISSIQEIVTDMTSGVLVRPKQPKEIAGALALLIDDASRRELYGKALKEKVDKDFSKRTMLAQTLGLYTALTVRHTHE
jgi:glycosyltransferase involved in cell wall biosynthesis